MLFCLLAQDLLFGLCLFVSLCLVGNYWLVLVFFRLVNRVYFDLVSFGFALVFWFCLVLGLGLVLVSV